MVRGDSGACGEVFTNVILPKEIWLINHSKIAHEVSNTTPADISVLIDCFSGVGGNTIAFAKSGRWREIHAIERDLPALECKA